MKNLNFTGSGFEYFKIWIVNILLTIITLGIYYPWAKVRNNRYLYANSTLHNDNFDYHATGKQLFISYLIAVGLFIIYSVVGELFPMVGLAFLGILLIAIPWLIYRSMRFNLKVTSFSNVRFGFDGSLKDSYITFLGYPLLFILLIAVVYFILGFFGVSNPIVFALASFCTFFLYIFAFAFFTAKKTNYLINSSKFGQGEFKTNLEVKKFVFITLKTAGIGLLALLIAAAISVGIFFLLINDTSIFSTLNRSNDSYAILAVLQTLAPLLVLTYFLLLLFGFVAIAYYITRQREYVFENTTLDEKINFSSTLKFPKLAFIMMTNLLAIVFTLGLAIPWAKVRMMRYYLENTHIQAQDISAYISDIQRESALGEEIGDVFDVDVAAI